jgi:hypothetical protein
MLLHQAVQVQEAASHLLVMLQAAAPNLLLLLFAPVMLM